jgi:hypothetical protein
VFCDLSLERVVYRPGVAVRSPSVAVFAVGTVGEMVIF